MAFWHDHFDQMAIIAERKFLMTGQTILFICPGFQSMTHAIIKLMNLLVQIITLMAVLAIGHGMTMIAGIRLNLPVYPMVFAPGYSVVCRFKIKVITMAAGT